MYTSSVHLRVPALCADSVGFDTIMHIASILSKGSDIPFQGRREGIYIPWITKGRDIPFFENPRQGICGILAKFPSPVSPVSPVSPPSAQARTRLHPPHPPLTTRIRTPGLSFRTVPYRTVPYRTVPYRRRHRTARRCRRSRSLSARRSASWRRRSKNAASCAARPRRT